MRKLFFVLLVIITFPLFADYKDNLVFAKRMYADGLYEEAINEFQRIIDEAGVSKEAEEAIYYSGESFLKLNNLPKAETLFKRLLEGFPNSSLRDKALFKLAETQFGRQDFQSASDNFGKLIETYPLSEQSKTALPYYLQSLYAEKKYNTVVEIGSKMISDYKTIPELAEVMFIMAKTYYALKLSQDADLIITQLKQKFPDSDARFKALSLSIDNLALTYGPAKAAYELNKQMDASVPRSFEKSLRAKLISLYLENANYQSAYEELDKLMAKYSQADELDYYVYQQALTRLYLQKNSEIIAELEKNQKIMRGSKYNEAYKVITAYAHYNLKQYPTAESIIGEIAADNDSVKFQADYLKAKIFEDTGRLKPAIDLYQHLLSRNFAYGLQNDIYQNLGNIYYYKLNNYILAQNYYQQLILAASEENKRQKANFMLALCREKQGDYNAAINQLKNITLNTVQEPTLKADIQNKTRYLLDYAVKNESKALAIISASLIGYLNDNDKAKLTISLKDVMKNEVKDLETAYNLLEQFNDDKSKHEKAILLLRMADKAKLEGNPSLSNACLNKLSMLTFTNPNLQEEIELRKIVFVDGIADAAAAGRVERFLTANPTSFSANYFYYNLASYYGNDLRKKSSYLAKINDAGGMSLYDYYLSCLDLGEYYYANQNYSQAVSVFNSAAGFLTPGMPDTFFDWADALYKNGNQEEGLQKYAELLRNSDSFNGFETAVKTVASSYRQKSNYLMALSTMLLIPEKNRDAGFYLAAADDYLALKDADKAKEALMRIENKDLPTLYKLADLHEKTGDLALAAYTYEQILAKEKLPAYIVKANYRLGQIAFSQERYMDAAAYYKKVLEAKDTSQIDLPTAVKEAVIANYQAENRPRAEAVLAANKKLFKDDETALDEIELSKGIYYRKVDLGKAKGIFKDLVGSKKTETSLKEKATFWYGICLMEDKKTDEALTEFLKVSNSADKNLANQAALKLGTIYFSKEDFQNSMRYYYTVIENDTNGRLAMDAAKNFAIVAKTIEEWDKAIEAYELILDRWGERGIEGETVFNIGFCYFRDKKYKKAIDMFEKSIPLSTDKALLAEAQYWIGESYVGLEDYETAIAAFLKVSYNYPDQNRWAGIAEFKAGETYLKIGQTTKARYIFERLIKTYGASSDVGQMARKRLETL